MVSGTKGELISGITEPFDMDRCKLDMSVPFLFAMTWNKKGMKKLGQDW